MHQHLLKKHFDLPGFLTMMAISLLIVPLVLHADINYRKTETLKGKDTRFFSHLLWTTKTNSAIKVKLLPSINATGKSSYPNQSVRGIHAKTEVRTLPDNFNHLIKQLINNTQFLRTDQTHYDYQIQFHIKRYDTLYHSARNNHLFFRVFSEIDRVWSNLHGDSTPSRVTLVLTLYDQSLNTLLEVPVSSELLPCQKAQHTMTFQPGPQQAFFDALATTTTGQTLIAAINRSLVEVDHHLKNTPIQFPVIDIVDNTLIAQFHHPQLKPGDSVQLIFPEEERMYHTGLLEIESIRNGTIRLHSIDTPMGSIHQQDRLQIAYTKELSTYKSVAGSAHQCHYPLSKKTKR